MTPVDVFERLRAHGEGRPLPTTETLCFPRATDPDRLVVAFVRMAGESSPWGIAVGAPDTPPKCFTTPELRNADLLAVMARQVAHVVLGHVGHPKHLPDGASVTASEDTSPAWARARQLWLPGPSHVEMLHLLDYRYTLAVTGEPEDLKVLRAFGRACGWLFRESTRPGQVRVHDATARLREAYVFPAEPQRQAHLGFLLGWLGDGPREARRLSAHAAEALPVGVTLLPAFEREKLSDAVERHNRASTAAEKKVWADVLHSALVPELTRRWELTVQAIRALEGDPRKDNPALGPVVDLGADEWGWQYLRHELNGMRDDLSAEERKNLGSHPETDFNPARAARRYFEHLHAHEVTTAELVHGDKTLLERSLDAGNGFRGTVTAVVKETVNGRARTRWTITTRADETLRLREESAVCMVGARRRAGHVVSVLTDERTRTLVVEFTDGLTEKTAPGIPKADAAVWVGRDVTFLDRVTVGLSLKKARNVGDAEGPGAWLTHAAPLPEFSPAGTIRPDLISLVRDLEK